MKSIFIACMVMLCAFIAGAQSNRPILERKITLTVVNQKLGSVLTQIAQQNGFSFSYNSSILNSEQSITINGTDKTIREVLTSIFKGTVDFKEKSNHLILTKVRDTPKKSTAVLIISGYIEDETTGRKIPDASVYDESTLASAVTDQYGFYRIKLDRSKRVLPVQLSVSKASYRDTLVMITAEENQYVTIGIRPVGQDSLQITASAPTDTLKNESEVPMPYQSEANVMNISDTLYRDIQISLLPFVGSNGRLSGNVINDYSINIFGGYSLGTRRLELGFFLNADRGDVSWLQIAGLGNLVGRNMYGIQAAGLFNTNGGEVKAVQLAGLANTNVGEATGIQVAGLANTNVHSADGVLVAGLSNVVNGASQGFQIAGGANIQVKDYKGSQIAGLVNVASGNIRGSQIAGLANVTHDRISGSQISSLFNYGRSVHGTQIGLVNIADTLHGIPLGLFSYVRHGYHKLELSADEVFYTNISFRTGVRQFYNILTAGVQPESMFGNNQRYGRLVTVLAQPLESAGGFG